MTIIRCVLLLVALIAWNASPASAQTTPCDPSQFDALTNMWKLEPDQNTREIPAGELAAERKVMQRVVEMFKSAFVPTGAAGYYGVNYDILPHADVQFNIGESFEGWFKSSDDFARQHTGEVLVLKLDTEASPATPVRFGIRGIPTLIVFENGREARRQVGAVQAADLEKLVTGRAEAKA